MIDHNEQRTNRHIRLVKKYGKILLNTLKFSDKAKAKFIKQIKQHDKDKFSK
jgi:hypothetical protein